jgi:GNAT superfamily N-acetyltransferase
MKLHIRPAQPEDSLVLTRLSYAAKRHWGYPEEWMRLWKEDLTVTREFIRKHRVYCALRESKIYGFYAFSGDGATRELEHMWVDPQFMGQGIGRVLFDHALELLRGQGCTRLKIVSDPNAETFYRKLGAVPVGRVSSRPEGRTLPLLELRLP